MMTTIEERTKEIDELYAEATTKKEYHRVWKLAQEFKEEVLPGGLGGSVKFSAQLMLNGFWARYYELFKFKGTKRNIEELYSRVANYYYGLEEEEDIDVRISYGYLLSVIVGQLKENLEEARKIDEEISKLAEKSGEVVSILRNVTAQGLTLMKKKEYLNAIGAFNRGWNLFPQHKDNPETFRHFGNIFNNRGLSAVRLSEELESRREKISFLKSGISDLTVAITLYSSETSPPMRHLEGIKNRLQLARLQGVKVFSPILFITAQWQLRRVNKLLKGLEVS